MRKVFTTTDGTERGRIDEGGTTEAMCRLQLETTVRVSILLMRFEGSTTICMFNDWDDLVCEATTATAHNEVDRRMLFAATWGGRRGKTTVTDRKTRWKSRRRKRKLRQKTK